MRTTTDPEIIVQICMEEYNHFNKDCFRHTIEGLSEKEFDDFCRRTFAINKYAAEYQNYYHAGEIELSEIPEKLQKRYMKLTRPDASMVTISQIEKFKFKSKLEPGALVQRSIDFDKIDHDKKFNKYLFLKIISELNEAQFNMYGKSIRDMSHHVSSTGWGYATKDVEYIPSSLKKDFFTMRL